ncbi:hypothetical protein G6F59_016132 [Rhizopus arrhizus]|nr:hypothetical protein G6F59_016132 [Rhizopus arrhizus]
MIEALGVATAAEIACGGGAGQLLDLGVDAAEIGLDRVDGGDRRPHTAAPRRARRAGSAHGRRPGRWSPAPSARTRRGRRWRRGCSSVRRHRGVAPFRAGRRSPHAAAAACQTSHAAGGRVRRAAAGRCGCPACRWQCLRRRRWPASAGARCGCR